MKMFKYMRGDATWDQEKQVRRICKWTERGMKLYSFDLTAATDRWPAWHQKLVVDRVFNKGIGEMWFRLMTTTTPYATELKRYIRYAIGQPMGAYSSWAVLNMTHHYVIRLCAKRIGVKALYSVLGDDVVIVGKELADEYRSYITRLGVKLNLNKSILNTDFGPCSAEFARHIVRDGHIVGTFSPSLVRNIYSYTDVYASIDLLREVQSKLGQVIHVYENTTLLPIPIVRLLKTFSFKDDLLAIVTVPLTALKLPRVYHPEKFEGDPMVGYDKFANPWYECDINSVNAEFGNKWMREASLRMNKLESLLDKLGDGGSTVYRGRLLEISSHPLRYSLKPLKEELMNQFWRVMRGEEVPIFSSQLQTDIDLLIFTLTEGKSFRTWRNSKTSKRKHACMLIKKVLKESHRVAAAMKELPTTSMSWEDYAKQFE
ncbi:RNA-dependent RNA polymerase [Shahe narna-like virus 5]|uniref:RNA-dependent RNA polymerase n=1 Tax=Shahe narna-like virus 5 TaxID=1923433 RepID=UPI00090A6986|nr:RNA-dependent RNA polymerase [Shahe narna-like virus 5]APG77167.1 RNA-dependent RNA polymerase [Shahe narna-like virus 5]